MKPDVFKALEFAVNAHSGQFRKGTKLPYIVHPVDVMRILISHNASTDAVIAGILHDTLEDTTTTVDDLKQTFGERITQLIMGASEPDKSLSWEERKKHTFEFLSQTNDVEQLMVACADKLSNVSTIKQDFDAIGNEIWKRFKRGYDQQKWYYCGLADIFEKHTDESDLFKDYVKLTHDFFVNRSPYQY